MSADDLIQLRLETALNHLIPKVPIDPETLRSGLEITWIPLAQQIATWRTQQAKPLVVGFLGGQGTGKTTLMQILTELLSLMGHTAISASIDDFYLTYTERQALQRCDPRLDRRGPPGTHDLALCQAVLSQFKAGHFPLSIPRFDKSAHQGQGDRTLPDVVEQGDIFLIEGWLIGLRPIDPRVFSHAPDPIVTLDDQIFARDMNQALGAYVPLWEKLDRLIVLNVADYRRSIAWRQAAEHRLIAQGRPGLSDREVADFVRYFWKALHPELFIAPLVASGAGWDGVIEIGSDHQPGELCLTQK